MDHLTASREWIWWASCWCHTGCRCSASHVEEMLGRHGQEPQFEFWLSEHMDLIEPRPLSVRHPHIVLERMARHPKHHERVLAWHRPEYIRADASCPFYAALLDRHQLLPENSSWRDCSTRLVSIMESHSPRAWDAFIDGHMSLDLYVLRHHPSSGAFLNYLTQRFVDELWVPDVTMSHVQKLFLTTLARAAAFADVSIVEHMLVPLACPVHTTTRDMAYKWICFLAPLQWRYSMHQFNVDVDRFYAFVAHGLNASQMARARMRWVHHIERMLSEWIPDLVSGDGYDRAWREGRI